MRGLEINMPEWALDILDRFKNFEFESDTHRSKLAVEVSKINVDQKTGGPFGAAIFNNNTNKLVGIGANFVLPSNTSLAHAECVAIGFAQQTLGTHDLSTLGEFSMHCSAQPCIMCFGALWWSGIRELVYAAHSDDVEKLAGFIEGPLPEAWKEKLNSRDPLPSLKVKETSPQLREAAKKILADYKKSGALVYNAGA